MVLRTLSVLTLTSEIGGTAGDRGNVNVMNVDGDVFDGGCNGEVLSDGVIGEEGVGADADEGHEVMKELETGEKPPDKSPPVKSPPIKSYVSVGFRPGGFHRGTNVRRAFHLEPKEGDKSSITRVTRTVLTDSSAFWEGVCWLFFGGFKF